MVAIDMEYLGDLRVQAVHEPSGTVLVMDAPVDNHGKGESFSPTDLVATGLGGCILTVMGIMAQNRGIDLTGTTVRVTKEMSTEGPRRIVRLATTVTVPHNLSEDDRTRLERGAHTCPVHRSLHPDIEAPITFIFDAG